MAWNPKGRVRVSPSAPEAQGLCDRCSVPYNLYALQFQYQWSGPRLRNTGYLVCRTCLDVPQEQLRSIVTPPDPMPVRNPRIENYTVEEDGPDYSGDMTGVAGTAAIGTITVSIT